MHSKLISMMWLMLLLMINFGIIKLMKNKKQNLRSPMLISILINT